MAPRRLPISSGKALYSRLGLDFDPFLLKWGFPQLYATRTRRVMLDSMLIGWMLWVLIGC